jgi:DNA-binding NarL/FixJ family response regulator
MVLLEWPLQAAVLPADRLTSAEIAVAELAVAGLGNAEIGRRRGTSERTVANQLASIYRKLGVGSRTELVAHLGEIAAGAPRTPARRGP